MASPKVGGGAGMSGGVSAAAPLVVGGLGSKREVLASGIQLFLIEHVEYFLRGRDASPGSITRKWNDSVAVRDPEEKRRNEFDNKLRLELNGFEIGQRLIERLAVDKDMLDSELDIVKFICRELWEASFSKQVDVLRTNRKGLYVLQDSNFKWLASLSKNRDGDTRSLEDYAVFPCGLVCGALHKLGMKCQVTADIKALPRVEFFVQMVVEASNT
ncbi:Trafficking protein particle complex subunit 6B [Porphyridium purpureum]|uniref:Trafficking protein particle complex subunit 6B n=1 Tax=Porphyridium purpureum TaxID=35688 RepID=A0A5J4YZJ1_PORPP|nr:Trafficking protein particle complex subunit 6B [Porphyridium purpureum]|eukprot:POR6518..scf208_2